MTRRVIAAGAIALLLTSCDLVHHIVTLTFNESATTVTISTKTSLGTAQPGTPEATLLAQTTEAILAERDEWSTRFANAAPEEERILYERKQGKLSSVDHSATIATEKLQRFFFDTPLTATVTRGEGWAELTIYGGTSLRASREQRLRAEKELALFSERAVAYFGAVATLYRYLDEKPARAEPVLTWMYRPFEGKVKGQDEPPISEQEMSIVESARGAITALLDSNEGGTMNKDLDAVYNPFPAELHVIVGSEPLLVEGFTTAADGGLVVKTVDPMEAMTSLEGRWISPDPIAVFSRYDKTTGAEISASVSAEPRTISLIVGPAEIGNALVEKMRPAPRYRVRWVVKPEKRPST